MRSRMAGVVQGMVIAVILAVAAALAGAALAAGSWMILRFLRKRFVF